MKVTELLDRLLLLETRMIQRTFPSNWNTFKKNKKKVVGGPRTLMILVECPGGMNHCIKPLA